MLLLIFYLFNGNKEYKDEVIKYIQLEIYTFWR